ncbi:MAG: PEP-CTERM sorting domain-containing protein [Myxococcota bacterium]
MLGLVLAAAVLPASAASLTVGVADVPGNGIPFGSNLGAGTRYQQIYDASSFSGVLRIEALSFFQDGAGNLRSGTYSVYLTTTSLGVNDLDLFDFDGNLGADVALFRVQALSGPAPAVLTFAGTSFDYDASLGNLLLDIRITGAGANPTGAARFDEDRTANGVFSKAHDFGAGFDGRGLVTEFTFTPIPEPTPAALLVAGVGFWAWRRRAHSVRRAPTSPAGSR